MENRIQVREHGCLLKKAHDPKLQDSRISSSLNVFFKLLCWERYILAFAKVVTTYHNVSNILYLNLPPLPLSKFPACYVFIMKIKVICDHKVILMDDFGAVCLTHF
jgi:hypothetical protein